jgi:hypothetical protein
MVLTAYGARSPVIGLSATGMARLLKMICASAQSEIFLGKGLDGACETPRVV